MHTARIWMASAIPGGAPGYDDDKQFGNFITHMATELPKGCANIAANPGKSREGHTKRFIHSLAGFFSPGEGENAPCSHARSSLPVIPGRSFHERPGMTVVSHAPASSGFTQENSCS
jgi:hypothetical protein